MEPQEIQQLGDEAVRGLAKNPSIYWFVDANVLIRGLVTELFEGASNVLILDKVRKEVRKRPEARRGNRFIDDAEKVGNVINEDWHDGTLASSVKFLVDCARSLAPAIRVNTQWFIDNEGLQPEQAEIRAIERAAVEGSFFQSEFTNNAVGSGLISKEDAQIDKRTRNSWFGYPKKRRRKKATGEYGFTDEDLVATAIATSILENKKICILTADKDLSAIFKQATDNWIWSASVMDCELSSGELRFEDLVALWEQRCGDLDRFRLACNAKRLLRICDDDVLDPAKLFMPTNNEVILCRADDSHIHMELFAFNDQMVEYARDFRSLLARYNRNRDGSSKVKRGRFKRAKRGIQILKSIFLKKKFLL